MLALYTLHQVFASSFQPSYGRPINICIAFSAMSPNPYGPETTVLKDLVHIHLPGWTKEVQTFIERIDSRNAASQREQEDEGICEEDVIGPAPPPKPEYTVSHHSAEVEKAVLTKGPDRQHQAPQQGKVRFSSLTGPVIEYDGDGQLFLFNTWKAIAEQRGGLRKEMMSIKKRLPTERPNFKPLSDVTEATDAIFDKVTKFIETASLLMLKGDPYRNLMTYIISRFKEASEQIVASNLMEPRPKSAPPISYDFGDESDGDAPLEADDGEEDDSAPIAVIMPPPRYSRAGARSGPRPAPRVPYSYGRDRVVKRPVLKEPVKEADDKLEADETLEVDDEIEVDGDSDTSMPDLKLKLPQRRNYGKLEADETLEVDGAIEVDGDSDTSMPDISFKLPERRTYGPSRPNGEGSSKAAA